MNTEKRKRLRELCDKATPGPWEPCGCRFSIVTAQITPQETMDICDTKINDAISCEQAEANNCFISAARNALPELLDDVDRLEARVKELSNPATWRATINRLESAELEALAELDERIAENAALKARVAELEGEITELTAPFSSGDPTKLTESEWARIHENVEKYAPKTPHVQVDKDGVWFIRLDLFASITEKLEARVEKLEEVRKAADATVKAMEWVGDVDWSETDGYHELRSALDRANKENQ